MMVALIIVVLVLVGLTYHHLSYRRRVKRELAQLLDFLTIVQNRNTVPEIGQQAEGVFRILQSEVYKLATLLQQQYTLEARHNQELSTFLSDISHQIKTPLAAILMMTNLLENDTLSQMERENYIASIESQVDRMNWLVKTLLVTAQLDAGVLVLKQEEIVLQDLLKQVFATHFLLAEVKGVDLVMDCPRTVTLMGDYRWLYEALSNIVKNCLEHTESGLVHVRVEWTSLSSNIWIEDTGQGISPNDLPRIFERFYKGSHSNKQSVGIGLSLAKDIIQHHYGTIQVSSQEGVGTCFHIRFYHRPTI